MPKVIAISNEVAGKLDAIRKRRRASYSEAILWLAGRTEGKETYDKLIAILSRHCGETGANEGAVETLERLLLERRGLVRP